MPARIFALGSLMFRRPQEFWDRMLTILSVRLEPLWVRPGAYVGLGLEEVLREVQAVLEPGLNVALSEPELTAIRREVTERAMAVEASAPFTFAHNADISLAQCCYAVCRVLKPKVVVETGVAYGVTSAFILKALEVNGEGTLHSIDLPPLGRDADTFVGAVIPEKLKKSWKLYRGVSKRVLPRLLTELGGVEFFLHDSLHTYGNIKRELSLVTPYLTRPGILVADDIQGNSAFLEWAQQTEPDFWAAVREQRKEAMFGVAVFR